MEKLSATCVVTAEWLLLGAFSLLLVFHTLPRAWHTLNTDFPNYYLAATLAREHVDTSRMYEWRWLQREKDHRAIDQPIIGLAPITPFSTLVVWPLTTLAPLAAKRVWLMLQGILLAGVVVALQRLTRAPLRRIVLLMAICIPLHRNLLYGQWYILLLTLIVCACLAYREEHSSLAGALIGLAAMLKIFPAVFLLYFLRKQDWRAVLTGVAMIAVCALVSIHVFGWPTHRVYLETVLPWTLRGEALPPYNLASSSLSTQLHRLFLYEPEWNPRPWLVAPMLYAALAPLLQILLVGPALLFAGAHREQAALEWAALLTATLTISTVPASYNFVLLLLPCVVLCEHLRGQRPLLAFATITLYVGIGYPAWNTAAADGWHALAHVPRLYLLVLFTALCCWVMAKAGHVAWGRETRGWAAALTLIVLVGIAASMAQQRGRDADYAYRIPVHEGTLLAADPAQMNGGIAQIVLMDQGYRRSDLPRSVDAGVDVLSFSHDLSEQAGLSSRLISTHPAWIIEDAHSPAVSPDGQRVAYIRDERGRGQLRQREGAYDVALTPRWMNVEEAAYLSQELLLVAAMREGRRSALYLLAPGAAPKELPLGEARYPAASPDGRWIAYSRFDAGAWNLWLYDRSDGRQRRLTQAPCNQTQPAWENDSATLLYASDCGRALGLTAICRRRVIPTGSIRP